MMKLTEPNDIIDVLHRLDNAAKDPINKASPESMLSRRLVQDSRQVSKGDIFVALLGHDSNGANYIDTAVQAGAAAVLVDTACQFSGPETKNVTIIEVEQLRDKLAALCQLFYFNGEQSLPLIGITGTNGKTSVSHILAQLSDLITQSQHADVTNQIKSCAVIGTMGTGHINALVESNNTTPGICDVYSLLAGFKHDKQHDFQAVAMEVSSHALAQGRVAGLAFETAIFTNLTHEHLDYHGTMEEYFAEKAKLFLDYPLHNAVINVDDEYGRQLANMLPESTRLVAYGRGIEVANYNEYVWVKTLTCHEYGLSLTVEWQLGGLKEQTELNLPLYGPFNAENIAAVFATVLLSGWSLDPQAYAKLKPVPGRLELFVEQGQPVAIVDYPQTLCVHNLFQLISKM